MTIQPASLARIQSRIDALQPSLGLRRAGGILGVDPHTNARSGRATGETFDAVLNQTLSPTASARPSRGPGRVPASVAGWSNGRLPNEVLVALDQPGHRLAPEAAAAYQTMKAAAAVDGLELRITDSYRSFDQQVDLVHRKGLYRDGGWAAVPGTSDHGWGLAVDVDVTDPVTLAWMRDHGPRFGFIEDTPREPWHWAWYPPSSFTSSPT